MEKLKAWALKTYSILAAESHAHPQIACFIAGFVAGYITGVIWAP